MKFRAPIFLILATLTFLFVTQCRGPLSDPMWLMFIVDDNTAMYVCTQSRVIGVTAQTVEVFILEDDNCLPATPEDRNLMSACPIDGKIQVCDQPFFRNLRQVDPARFTPGNTFIESVDEAREIFS